VGDNSCDLYNIRDVCVTPSQQRRIVDSQRLNNDPICILLSLSVCKTSKNFACRRPLPVASLIASGRLILTGSVPADLCCNKFSLDLHFL